MNQYLTGLTIKELREKNGLTQFELAKKLNVSDKAISKWETGKGFPDITLLEPIAKVFNISVAELLSGNTVTNTNISANLKKGNFYVCPVCGNVIFSIGNALITCHGITLPPLSVNENDSAHGINTEYIEDEIFVSSKHPMTKNHYISFFAAVSSDRVQITKMYAQGNAETRFKRNTVEKIYCYCNKDGLFEIKL